MVILGGENKKASRFDWRRYKNGGGFKEKIKYRFSRHFEKIITKIHTIFFTSSTLGITVTLLPTESGLNSWGIHHLFRTFIERKSLKNVIFCLEKVLIL